MVLLRSPVSVDEVRAAVLRAVSAAGRSSAGRPAAPVVPHADAWAVDVEVAPRLFSQEQLASLANVSSTIDCECPQHLAQLVADLSAFEIYSARCAHRDAEDAALHRYLHKTSGRARAMIEHALERVARAEGIEF